MVVDGCYVWSEMMGVLVVPPSGSPYFRDTDNLDLLFREVENLIPADRLNIKRHLFGVGSQVCSAWFMGRAGESPNPRAQALLRSSIPPRGTIIISGSSSGLTDEPTTVQDSLWERLLAR